MRFDDIRQWAHDRNLIHGSTPEKQMLKLTEEVGELAEAILRDDPGLLSDAIGDCIVVLTILAAQMQYRVEDNLHPNWMRGFSGVSGLRLVRLVQSTGKVAAAIARGNPAHDAITMMVIDLADIAAMPDAPGIEACIERAWLEIKDRKGRMQDGVFIKEEV